MTWEIVLYYFCIGTCFSITWTLDEDIERHLSPLRAIAIFFGFVLLWPWTLCFQLIEAWDR